MKKAIVVFRHPGSKWDSSKPVREQPLWDDHARFMDSLFNGGHIILAGPFVDASGAMVILASGSVEEAQTMLRNDPWALLDILVTGEVKEWMIFLDARDRLDG